MIAIEAGCLLTPFEEISPGVVVVDDGRIVAVGLPSEVVVPPAAEIIQAPDKTLVPGFIDTHTHGREGIYFGESTKTTIELCRSIVSTGVTSLLPTLASLKPLQYDLEMILDGIRVVRRAQGQAWGAEILGIHMEGPFLSGSDMARGSQLVSNMRKPSVEELDLMVEASDRTIRKMTIAPELEGALDVIREMVRLGIVACAGHSAASYEEVQEAVGAGLNCATHTFNAMLPFHHRQPGLLGAVLTNDSISAELIADGQHVVSAAMKILLRCKGPERVHLVTDNTIWSGLPNGIYQDGDRKIVKKDKTAHVEGGTLVGSVAPMNHCIGIMVRQAGSTLCEAVRMASFNAAALIGCEDRKGSIEAGKDADLVLLGEDFSVHLTMAKGRILHRIDE